MLTTHNNNFSHQLLRVMIRAVWQEASGVNEEGQLQGRIQEIGEGVGGGGGGDPT